MLRMLNDLEVACGNFYYDSRAMETMLEGAASTLPIPQSRRIVAIPGGHFHCSPVVAGVIVARNFHFLCHLTTESASGIVDVYLDGVEYQQAVINQLISKHCQPTTTMMHQLRDTIDFSSGSYVSFELPFQKFGDLLDRVTILANALQFGHSHPVFIPPARLDQPGYDLLQVFTSGYIAIHSTGDILNVDVMANQELSSQTIQTWFPESRALRFLPRAF